MKEKYYIELGSITGKRVWFSIPGWKLENWKSLLTEEEKQYWAFEKFHNEPPLNITEWDLQTSLMKLM
jgi:hypothetical protein